MKKTLIYTSLGMALLGYSNAQIRTGFNTSSLAANDDGSTALVGLGFDIDFFGNTRSGAYVNNNGNITFDAPFSEFSPSDVAVPVSEIIAPFFADVDTRGDGSSLVTYGTGNVDGRSAFGVNWVNVGYFASRDDLLNSFQLVIVDRSDIIEGGFDIEFNYGQIQWETGEADGGVDGLGGDSARVFYSNGDGTNFEELAGSGVDGAFLDGGSNALTELNEDGVQGRFIILVRDGGIVEEDEIIVIELTDPFVNTLRDTVIGFSSQMSSDINNRLLRLRSGFNFENSDTLGSPMMGIVAESNPWLNKVSLYADINHFEYSIDSRNVFTAGGLLSTTLPETEVTGQRGLVGLEYSKNRNLSIGFASVFGIGDADHSDGSFRGDYTGYGLFGYASYRSDKINNTGLRFYGDALLGYQGGQVDTTQTSGGLRASGETEYNGLSFELNTGLIYQYGKFEHTGFLQLRGNHGQVNSYRASGVGVGLDVPEFDYDSQTLAVGYQLSTTRAYKCGNVTPFVSVSYEEELEEQDGLINGNPVASGPSDAVVFSGGIQFQPQQDMFVSFEGQHKSFDNGDSSSLGVSLGIKF